MTTQSATTTAPRTVKEPASSPYAPIPRHHDALSRLGCSPTLAFDQRRCARAAETSGRDRQASGSDRPVRRFLSHFSGPIIWAAEITTVLLIVLTHSLDFVGVVIIANLVMIVIMMVFRTSLGLWQDSHPTSTLDFLDRRESHHFDLRLR